MNDSILITPCVEGTIVAAADEARAIRDVLVIEAATVAGVRDRLDADDATQTLKKLTAFAKTIEEQRVSASAPVLALAKSINAMSKELTASVTAEADRIGLLLGTYEAEERRKADEIRRRAQAEEARIAHEAQQKAAAAMATEPDDEKALRASDAIIETAAAKVAEVRQVAINAAVPKAAGTRLGSKIAFEIDDIAQVYASHPMLVTLEPNGPAIRAILKQNPNLKVPGLRHWTEHKLS